MIRELEGRLSESSRQEAACSEAYSRLAQEKVTLEGTMEAMRHELGATNERFGLCVVRNVYVCTYMLVYLQLETHMYVHTYLCVWVYTYICSYVHMHGVCSLVY